MFFEKDLSHIRSQDSIVELPLQTKSVCPECTNVLDAILYEDSGLV